MNPQVQKLIQKVALKVNSLGTLKLNIRIGDLARRTARSALNNKFKASFVRSGENGKVCFDCSEPFLFVKKTKKYKKRATADLQMGEFISGVAPLWRLLGHF